MSPSRPSPASEPSRTTAPSRAVRRARASGGGAASARGATPRSRWVLWTVVGVVALAAVVAIALVALSGDGGDAEAKVEIADSVAVRGTPLPGLPAQGSDPAVGVLAPQLRGVSFDGSSVDVAPTGTPRVLVFVAHWCPHCQAEVPRIVDLAKAGGTKGVDVVGVATGTSSTYPNYPPSAWLRREGWPFPVLVDTQDATAAAAYGLRSYPFLVFLDADGKVAGRASGEMPPEELAALFDALRAGTPLPLSSVPGASSPSR